MAEEEKKASDEVEDEEPKEEEVKEEKEEVKEEKEEVKEEKEEVKEEKEEVKEEKIAPAAVGKGKEVKVPAKFKDLVKQIEGMSIMDLAELVKILEEKFGVSPIAAAPVAGAASGAEEEDEEKTVFTVELKDAGSQKIQVIKVVREITGKGLKESKELTDKVPQVVKENVKKEEAEELKKKLEEAGGTVELK